MNVFAENCPACLTADRAETVAPFLTFPEGDSVRARYHCIGCGYRWETSWLASALAADLDGAA